METSPKNGCGNPVRTSCGVEINGNINLAAIRVIVNANRLTLK